MKLSKENINAILGTILFHLIIVIILLVNKIQSLTIHEETYMIIEPEYIEEITKKPVEENILGEDFNIQDYINEFRNVASNNPVQYQKFEAMSEDELRKYYETQFLNEKYGDNPIRYQDKNQGNQDKQENKENSKNDKSKNENNNSDNYQNYSGPALVFVELENPKRGKIYIEVPVFTCRHGGKVVVDILIGSDGRVRSANVISANSSGDASCISEAALRAARNSRFTMISGGKNEKGKITYTFIEQ
ncbi:MAG TPA: TonB family protein [Bacteroidales bacterium]|nr:TonB family protein [Bacteroidales bacterium]HOL97494.1 TonB family protein [Bacteroidales bacterium]HOM35762.1 TonB family protein [Bacteroidales bacterium]HPD23020.1 TonB family protein [Bacteroidales bacterium]HRS98859.1 TonB family protein [Bacteroidales bacterium]